MLYTHTHTGNLKNKKGITLVALVVTIIILLILAGISIASLTGNGLFEKAKLAKEKSEKSKIKENSILEEYTNIIQEYGNIGGTRSPLPTIILYPNGTEENPSTIAVNERIEINNPYPGHILYLVVQLQTTDGLWCEPGFIYNSSVAGGVGVKATQLLSSNDDKIVIQARKLCDNSWCKRWRNRTWNKCRKC